MKKDSARPLPSPMELKEALPLLEKEETFIKEARSTIRAILNGEDRRLLLIVGPCSIHHVEAAKEYALRLKRLAKEVEEHFFIVMRVYYEKSRTVLGWKGLVHDPHLDQSQEVEEGLTLTRKLLLDLAKMEVPTAVEFLHLNTPPYFSDLVSWGCIGARTTESQPHREMASGLPMPIGFKNTTDGNMQIAINAILSASTPHSFIGINEEGRVSFVKTEGNPDSHLVLRGGKEAPNYDPSSIQKSLYLLLQQELPPRLLVDCSHDNSRRCHENQTLVFQSVIEQCIKESDAIRGILLESYLKSGKQEHVTDKKAISPDLSLTDPCLDWESTAHLIRWAKEQLYEKQPAHALPL